MVESAMVDALSVLRPVVDTLDGLGLAACVFDENDATLLWNRSFLKFFPEHAADIHVGEPYRANLRRFYQCRLSAEEMPSMEHRIEEGVVRHRTQQRAFVFEHRGVKITVSSLPMPGVGRIRIWQQQAETGGVIDRIAGAVGAVAEGGDAAFDAVADGIMVTGADDRITSVNEAFAAMYGVHDRATAVGARFEDIVRAAWRRAETEQAGQGEASLTLLAENMSFAGAPFEVQLPDDRWSRVLVQRSFDGKGIFAHVDITTFKRQQQQLLRAEQRARESEAILKEKSALLEATLERMEQGVMMVSPQRIVEVCNRRALELLDLPRELMERRPTFAEVLEYQWSTDEFVHTPQDIQEFVRAGGILDRAQCYDRMRPDGRVVEVQSVPIEGGGVLRTYTDITERKRAEERIRHVARHDGLTSLVTREVFLEHLAGATGNAERIAEGFAVHYIDINRFKPINDRYGHAVGDKVLTLVATRMRQIARDADVVARMGGDEFAVLQFNVPQHEKAVGLAHRLLQGVGQVMEIETHRLRVGASIGIALCSAAGADADQLLRNADAAMYAAKAKDSDCVRIHGLESRFAAL
jgi:diguanylate cyclase (GGDEF)-like protein